MTENRFTLSVTAGVAVQLQLIQGISRKGAAQILRQVLSKYEARQSSFCKWLL